MAYKHGTYQSEVPTSLIPAAQLNTPIVVIGCAPMYNAVQPAEVGVPVLCYSFSEAKSKFGWSDDYENFDVCEMMDTAFMLYNIAPIVAVNLLDTSKHFTEKSDTIDFVNGVAVLNDMVIPDSIALDGMDKETDFSVEIKDNKVTILLEDKSVVSAEATFHVIDTSKVTADEAKEAMAQLKYVYPRFGMIPSFVVAPRFSKDGGVLSAMKSNAKNISDGRYSTVAIVDIDDNVAVSYDKAKEYKDTYNLVEDNGHLIDCWPKVTNGDNVYRMSTHLACLCMQIDASDPDGCPYMSPSNHTMQIDGTMAGGKTVFLEHSEATYLNSIGVVTALNENGWKCWGNRTSCYPANTDVKDSFIPIRRSFCWFLNNLTTTYFAKVDNPTNERLIHTVVDSANDWLNAHVASGHLLGGRVAFLKSENSTTNLMDGIIRFHVYLTPPSPAREIDFIAEYDTGYVANLFN